MEDEDLLLEMCPWTRNYSTLANVDIQYLVIDDLEAAAAAEEGGRDSDNESVE